MYKLKDIIKSGGCNAKINRFINKYILSKDEKKDVIQEIKNSKGGSSDSLYFILSRKDFTEDTAMVLEALAFISSGLSYACIGTGGYTYVTNIPTMFFINKVVPEPDRFICYKIVLGHIESYKDNDTLPGMSINVDINNKEDLCNFLSYFTNIDVNNFKDKLTEITEEQFFDKQWLLNKASELNYD